MPTPNLTLAALVIPCIFNILFHFITTPNSLCSFSFSLFVKGFCFVSYSHLVFMTHLLKWQWTKPAQAGKVLFTWTGAVVWKGNSVTNLASAFPSSRVFPWNLTVNISSSQIAGYTLLEKILIPIKSISYILNFSNIWEFHWGCLLYWTLLTFQSCDFLLGVESQRISRLEHEAVHRPCTVFRDPASPQCQQHFSETCSSTAFQNRREIFLPFF